MEKVYVEHYVTYGKRSGHELYESYVMLDTKEEREGSIDPRYYYFDEVEDFVNSKVNSIYYDSSGGDWDDPTGGYILISTLEDKLESLEKEFLENTKHVIKLFEEFEQAYAKEIVD